MEIVSVRLSDEELDLLDRLAAERAQGRSDAIREAIRRGAREELIRLALERYRDGEVGVGEAAAIADVSIGRLLNEANERAVLSTVEAAELDGDVDAIR